MITIGSFLFNIRFISTSFVKVVMVADIQTVAMTRSNCRATQLVFQYYVLNLFVTTGIQRHRDQGYSTMMALFDKIDEWSNNWGEVRYK